MEALGTPFKQRWAVTRERIEAMKALWADEEAEYHGQHVNIDRTSVRPAPVQQPHPPIYIGAGTKWARQRVVEWADGWLPLLKPPDQLAPELADLRERGREDRARPQHGRRDALRRAAGRELAGCLREDGRRSLSVWTCRARRPAP